MAFQDLLDHKVLMDWMVLQEQMEPLDHQAMMEWMDWMAQLVNKVLLGHQAVLELMVSALKRHCNCCTSICPDNTDRKTDSQQEHPESWVLWIASAFFCKWMISYFKYKIKNICSLQLIHCFWWLWVDTPTTSIRMKLFSGRSCYQPWWIFWLLFVCLCGTYRWILSVSGNKYSWFDLQQSSIFKNKVVMKYFWCSDLACFQIASLLTHSAKKDFCSWLFLLFWSFAEIWPVFLVLSGCLLSGRETTIMGVSSLW